MSDRKNPLGELDTAIGDPSEELPTRPPPGGTSASATAPPRRNTPLGLGAVTVPPPLSRRPTPVGPIPALMRPALATFTDEDAIESARALSAIAVHSARPKLDSLDDAFGGLEAPSEPPPTTARYGDHIAPSAAPTSAAMRHAGDGAEPASTPVVALMRSALAIGDFSGALAAAAEVLSAQPTHAEAMRVADECRSTLRGMYIGRLGSLESVPVVMAETSHLRYANIDHRAGFVLSHIDGVSTVEMILDVSGMGEVDALRVLCTLLDQRIIAVR